MIRAGVFFLLLCWAELGARPTFGGPPINAAAFTAADFGGVR